MTWQFGRLVRKLHAFYKLNWSLAEDGLTIARRTEMERLKSDDRYTCGPRLVRWGYKIYSQHEEDGILAEIFRRIGCETHYFVECGVGDGLENNTLALLAQEWSGTWIEGSPDYCQRIRRGMPMTLGSRQLVLHQALITRDNIDDLIRKSSPPREIDLLSIDIDGNDFHVWHRIECVQARVVVMEYNPKFPPPIEYCMEYDATHSWDYSDHYGASLSFLEREFRTRGYLLVACDLTGTNAFFVRSDLARGNFTGPFSPEFHYESARFELGSSRSGHPASYQTIEKRMRLRQFEAASLNREAREAGSF